MGTPSFCYFLTQDPPFPHCLDLPKSPALNFFCDPAHLTGTRSVSTSSERVGGMSIYCCTSALGTSPFLWDFFIILIFLAHPSFIFFFSFLFFSFLFFSFLFFSFSFFRLFRATPALRLGVGSELLLPAYARAIAMPDSSRICDLHHSSQQHRILNTLSEVRD